MLWWLLVCGCWYYWGAGAIPLHDIRSTFPQNSSFSSPPPQGQPAEYSTSHCFSNSLQPDGWRSTACYVKNLCFDTKTKDFVFFSPNTTQGESEVFPPISIGTFNYKWGSQYDKTVKFRPTIVYGPIPPSRKMASPTDLWIPFLPFCAANIGHLVWDDYLAWFLLSFTVNPLVGHSVALRPLWFNPKHDPPWATCDWLRLHEGPGHSLIAGYSNRCFKNNERWLPLMIGAGNTKIPETSQFAPLGQDDDGALVCFPHSASGLTAFANQGSGHHGWKPNDPPPPAFGRSPLLFQYTRHMMKHIGVADAPAKSVKELVVFFSSGSSQRLYINFGPSVRAVEDEVPALEAMLLAVGGKPIKVVVKHATLFSMSAKEQVELVSTACLYVTAAGGGAFTAQFLPRGSGIVLYEDSVGEHLHKGKVDWKFFNAVAWMRPTFWPATEKGNTAKLLSKVRQELLQCLAFMEALDV